MAWVDCARRTALWLLGAGALYCAPPQPKPTTVLGTPASTSANPANAEANGKAERGCATVCAKADPHECGKDGFRHLKGDGVPKDATCARAAFEKACSGGVMAVCMVLGGMVQDGRGGPKDPVRAVDLFRTACDRGVARACTNLAMALTSGSGVKRDLEEGIRMLQAGCESKEPKACAVLGKKHADGDGVAKDEREALRLTDLACSLGEPTGCGNLAVIYDHGNGVPADPARADSLYEKACADGDGGACGNLGLTLELGRRGTRDEPRALKLYEQGCRLENWRACKNAGLMRIAGRGGREADPRAAEAALRTACAGGYDFGCFWLGSLLQRGSATSAEASDLKAKVCKRDVPGLRRSCDAGDVEDCAAFAHCTRQGLGVRADENTAKEYATKGCGRSYGWACER